MSVSNLKTSTPQKKQIARAFGLKANKYDFHATVQKKILYLLKDIITKIPDNGLWADFGCGTGVLEEILSEHDDKKSIIGIDIAIESLKRMLTKVSSRVHPVAADLESLPFRENCFQGIVISSVIQWFSDPSSVLIDCNRKLKKDGMLIFSVFTSESFRELNQLRVAYGMEIPVQLPPKESISSLLNSCGYTVIFQDSFKSVEYFTSAFDLLRSLSAIGGTAVTGHRFTRNELNCFCQDFENRYRSPQGIPLTYELVWGAATRRDYE